MDKKKKGLMVIGGLGAIVAIALSRKAKAAPPPPPPPGLANLYGKVTDASTGNPIAGVLAILPTRGVTTDSGGNYIFVNLNPGGYTATFIKEGYGEKIQDIFLIAGNNELNVALVPTTVGFADIRLINLIIQEPVVFVDRENIITVYASNFGTAHGTKLVTLTADGIISQQSVTLLAGETKLLSFTVIPRVAKIYYVEVDGLSGSFIAQSEIYVMPPETPTADIRLSNLTVQYPVLSTERRWTEFPDGTFGYVDVVFKKAITSVVLTNYASEGGFIQLIFRVNGALMGQAIYYVLPNWSITITFEFTPPGAGTYTVDINGLTGSFTAI